MAYDEQLAERVRTQFAERNVSFKEKRMMGGLCFLVDSKMCVGVEKDRLMARVDPAIYEQLLQRNGCRPMNFTGRPLRGFVFVDPDGYWADGDLSTWMDLALEFNPRAKSSRKQPSPRVRSTRGRKTAQPAEKQPIIGFRNPGAFRRWLEKHHATHPGIWMKIAKKGSGLKSITYPQALDEALCFGWIDGQKNPFDKDAWLQKFTRRGPRSVWSKVNVGHVERLTRESRMQPAGRVAVEAAKADGRWEQAYHSIRTAEVPADFLKALARHPKALAFYDSLNRSNRFAIYYRLNSAKRPETLARRFKEMVGMMKRGEKFR